MPYVNWINKYKPQDLSQIIGNKIQIDQLDRWIKSFDKGEFYINNTVTLSGLHGTGKTSILELVLQKYNYVPFYVTSSNIKSFFEKSKKEKDEDEEEDNKKSKKVKLKFTENPLEQLLISNEENLSLGLPKRALIISDAEKITLKKECSVLISLCKINKKAKKCPIIFTTNNNHSPLINNIKDMTYVININQISDDDLLKYLDNVCTKEGLNLSKDLKLRKGIIFHVKKDISSLLIFLEDLYDIYGNDDIVIGKKECISYIKTSFQRDLKNKLYDSTKILLDEFQGIKRCSNYFEQNNKILLPLMIYENFQSNIELRTCPDDQYYANCLDILRTFSDADQISTHIYTEQNWYLQTLYGFKTCCEATMKINKYPMRHNSYNITFTNDMTENSVQKNKKTINSIMLSVKNKSLNDILMLQKYLTNLIRLNKLCALKRVLESYNISKDEMPLLLVKLFKIDKTVPPVSINGKIKKYIKLS